MGRFHFAELHDAPSVTPRRDPRSGQPRRLSRAEIARAFPGVPVTGSRDNWPPTHATGRFAVERTVNGAIQVGERRYSTYEQALLAAGMHRDALTDAQVGDGIDYQPITLKFTAPVRFRG